MWTDRSKVSLAALLFFGLAACSDNRSDFRFGEWSWDITITRDGQDFLDQSTDCMTKAEAEDGFDYLVRDFASAYQCFTKTIDIEGAKGVVMIDNCTDRYVNGVFTIRRRSAERYTIDATYQYRDGSQIGDYEMSVNAKHLSDTCRLKID